MDRGTEQQGADAALVEYGHALNARRLVEAEAATAAALVADAAPRPRTLAEVFTDPVFVAMEREAEAREAVERGQAV